MRCLLKAVHDSSGIHHHWLIKSMGCLPRTCEAPRALTCPLERLARFLRSWQTVSALPGCAHDKSAKVIADYRLAPNEVPPTIRPIPMF